MSTTSADPAPAESPLLTQASTLARRVEELAIAVGRGDLLEELATAQQERPESAVTVVVCGERDAGKRAVINALFGRPGLLPAAEEASTARPVTIRACRPGEDERILLHRLNGPPGTAPLEELHRLVTEEGEGDLRYLEVTLNAPLLEDGLALVDSPAMGGLGRAHGRLALSWLAGAEAALLVLDGGAPIGPVELGFLDEATQRVDNVVVVLDRHDRQHGWREVMAETEGHMADLDPEAGRALVLPISARMKLRADRMLESEVPDAELAEDLVRESGVPELRDRLARLARGRSGALRGARLCRLAGLVVERLYAGEEETLQSADRSTQELRDRLQDKLTSRDAFARELPTLRRALGNELRLLQKEADADSVVRLNEVRRSFDKRVAEREKGDLEADLEAELLKALETSVEDVRGRLEAAGQTIEDSLQGYGVELDIERGALEPGVLPTIGAVEIAPSLTGKGEWMARAPMAFGAVVFNPLYAIVAVAGILVDRQRVRRRAEREQLSRQVTETINEARAQLSVAVHHAVVNGQSVLTESFEAIVAQHRDELEEEIGAIKAQVSLSEGERAQRAGEAEQRLALLKDLRLRIAETRRGALGTLAGSTGRPA